MAMSAYFFIALHMHLWRYMSKKLKKGTKIKIKIYQYQKMPFKFESVCMGYKRFFINPL